VNTVEYQQVLGRRIAEERRRHGLSQPELAALVDRPVAWLSQLERGVQPIDKPSLLKSLADALELPLPELAAGAPATVLAAGRVGAAERLRVVLAGSHALCAMFGEIPAPPLSSLRMCTDRACSLARAGDYDELAGVLTDLLPGLASAVRIGPPAQRADAYELKAMAYQACSTALVKLNDPLAAWIAADRAMSAAENAGNLLLAAAGQYRLASVFLDCRELGLADEAARTTLLALRGLAEVNDPDALSLCGGLSRLLAARLGTQQANGMPEFSAQYVALYEISVSVELGDAGHALRTAATVDTSTLSPGRHARMLIDVARAHALRQQVDEATAALLLAEDLGPCQARDHDRACQVVRELLAIRTPPCALIALAERMGAMAG
jgi:transcriptional regulator with XRE-family HTH domain